MNEVDLLHTVCSSYFEGDNRRPGRELFGIETDIRGDLRNLFGRMMESGGLILGKSFAFSYLSSSSL